MKLVGTTEWMGTHMENRFYKTESRVGIGFENLLEDKALEEGEEYEYLLIENVEPMPCSTLKKENVPSSIATLVGNIKKLKSEDLKHVLSAVTLEIEERKNTYGKSIQTI